MRRPRNIGVQPNRNFVSTQARSDLFKTRSDLFKTRKVRGRMYQVRPAAGPVGALNGHGRSRTCPEI